MPLYEPDFGLPCDIPRPQLPAALFASGSLDPHAMESLVRRVLTFNVGPILPEASAGLRSWRSLSSTGVAYAAWGGDFRTALVPFPPPVLAALLPSVPPPDQERWRERQLRVRFWGEEPLSAPGSAEVLYLRLEALVRGGLGDAPTPLIQGPLIFLAASDFLTGLRAG